MGFYLIDNENPKGKERDNEKRGHYYPSRSRAITGIVVHTADMGVSALSIAKKYAKTKDTISAHAVVDSQEIIQLLPDGYTAFHARGSNSNTLGLQIAYYASEWAENRPLEDAVITLCAKWAREKVELYGIPVRRVGLEDWLKGEGGFITNAELNPSHTKSPGMNFPWEQFFTLIKEKAYRKAKRQAPRWNGRVLIYTSPMMISDDIPQWQDMAGGIVADGRYGRESEKRSKEIVGNS